MKEILLTSSVLILALLALRRLFRRTISRRMQYALWALVLVRLLIPGSLGSMAHNVLTVTEPVQTAVAERLEDSALYLPTAREPLPMRPGVPDIAPELAFPDGASSAWLIENDETAVQYRRISTAEVLTYVWYAGMLAVGAWFLFTNLRFSRALRRARTPYPVDNCRYPVYLVPELSSPCLFGVFRPVIYLNDTAASPEALRFVLAHEQTHARHLDPLWSLLRGVCLTVYWFDPLVWLAAMLSREDCELACDEGTLHVLGETERIAYGKTLLSLVPVRDKPQNPLLGATTMTSGKKSLKERITRIAENRQAKAAAVFAVLALTILVCAVSFTGATKTYTVTQEWYDAGFSEEDAQACLAFLDWAEDFDIDDANAASWLAESGAADFKALDGKPTEMAAAFAQAVKSIRAEELSPLTDSSNEVTYTLSIADRRKGFGFSLSENWQVALIAPAEYEADGEPFTYGKPVAMIDNAALANFLRGMFRLTEEASATDFIQWCGRFRSENATNLSISVDSAAALGYTGETLKSMASELTPLLRALTEEQRVQLPDADAFDSAICLVIGDNKDEYMINLSADGNYANTLHVLGALRADEEGKYFRPEAYYDAPWIASWIRAKAIPLLEGDLPEAVLPIEEETHEEDGVSQTVMSIQGEFPGGTRLTVGTFELPEGAVTFSGAWSPSYASVCAIVKPSSGDGTVVYFKPGESVSLGFERSGSYDIVLLAPKEGIDGTMQIAMPRSSTAPAESGEFSSIDDLLRHAGFPSITGFTANGEELVVNSELITALQDTAQTLKATSKPPTPTGDYVSAVLTFEGGQSVAMSVGDKAGQVRFTRDEECKIAESRELSALLYALSEARNAELHDLDNDSCCEALCWTNKNGQQNLIIYGVRDGKAGRLDVHETLGCSASDYAGNIANFPQDYGNLILAIKEIGKGGDLYRYHLGTLQYVTTMDEAVFGA